MIPPRGVRVVRVRRYNVVRVRHWNAVTPAKAGVQIARSAQAVKLLPQPQPPVAFGFVKVNPLPCIEET